MPDGGSRSPPRRSNREGRSDNVLFAAGTLTASDGRMAVVECGGVGYLCTISLQTHGSLPPLGEQVMLYTYLSVREDAMELYGFATLRSGSV